MLEIEKKESKNLIFKPESLVQLEQAEPQYDMGNVYEQEMLTRKLTNN